jgi:hypothetical protein
MNACPHEELHAHKMHCGVPCPSTFTSLRLSPRFPFHHTSPPSLLPSFTSVISLIHRRPHPPFTPLQHPRLIRIRIRGQYLFGSQCGFITALQLLISDLLSTYCSLLSAICFLTPTLSPLPTFLLFARAPQHSQRTNEPAIKFYAAACCCTCYLSMSHAEHTLPRLLQSSLSLMPPSHLTCCVARSFSTAPPFLSQNAQE